MEYITYHDYLRYRDEIGLKEESEEYEIQIKTTCELEKKEIKEINNKHDKMFRKILSRSDEMAKFLNQFLDVKENIRQEELIACSTDFITGQYQDKHSDILYRLRNKAVYFLVEHQSSVDFKMIERIGIYVEEIMKRERKNYKYPIVVPIVIYTGYRKWNAKMTLAEKLYHYKDYKEYEINLKYNLITIHNYSFEELIKKQTLFSYIMLIEKCETEKELISYTNKMIEKIENIEEKEQMIEIIINIIASKIGKEHIIKMMKKLEKKGDKSMSPLTKLLFELEEKGKREGKKEGLIEGALQGILKVAKNMLDRNMEIEEIQEITGLSKEEIKSLAQNKT